eukprot:5822048-Pleurochrysis_carterae.AAC.3
MSRCDLAATSPISHGNLELSSRPQISPHLVHLAGGDERGDEGVVEAEELPEQQQQLLLALDRHHGVRQVRLRRAFHENGGSHMNTELLQRKYW